MSIYLPHFHPSKHERCLDAVSAWHDRALWPPETASRYLSFQVHIFHRSLPSPHFLFSLCFFIAIFFCWYFAKDTLLCENAQWGIPHCAYKILCKQIPFFEIVSCCDLGNCNDCVHKKETVDSWDSWNSWYLHFPWLHSFLMQIPHSKHANIIYYSPV